MKKILLIFLFFTAIVHAQTQLKTFIDTQLSQNYLVLDINSSVNDENSILQKRYSDYSTFLSTLIQNREKRLNSIYPYAKDIFHLQRKIDLNKQRGNNYAVLRDRIKNESIKAEEIIQEMLTGLISSSYEKTHTGFKEALKTALSHNHARIEKLNSSFQEQLDKAEASHKIIIKAEENLVYLNSLIGLNNDLRKYIYAYQDSIYQSSLYVSFGFNRVEKLIHDTAIAKQLNPLLSYININTSKLLLILIIILITLSANRIFYSIIKLIVDQWGYKVEETQLILNNIRNVIRMVIILFGLELIVDIFLGIGEHAHSSGKFFTMSYVVLITYLVYKIANTIAIIKINSIHQHTQAYRNEVINLGIKGLNFIIFLVGLLIILKVYGVDLTAILSGLGIGSLAIAFAAKDTLANFFGSISILLDNPFAQGDMIEVEGHIGTVIEIGLRSTTIRTFENGMITIPNITLTNTPVENWSKRQLGRRIKMNIGVTYESDFSNIRHAVDEIESMLQTHPKIASNKTSYDVNEKNLKFLSKEDQVGIKRLLLVRLDNFSASSIDILLYCFAKSTDWEEWLEAKEDIMYKVASILEKNKLSFAYPALAVHMNEASKSLE